MKTAMAISTLFVFKAIILVCIHVIRCTSQPHNTNPFMLSNIINKYVKPYLGSIKIEPIRNGIIANRKSATPTTVKRAIEDKLTELKPYFEDTIATDNPTDNLETDEENEKEETTIIEFVPSFNFPNMKARNTMDESEPSNKHVHKYQKMRDKIKTALENEAVSSKTKKMVVRTIDGMINKLVTSHCEWNTKQKQILRQSANGANCQINNITLTKEECRDIVIQYFAATNSNGTRNKIEFSDDFHKTANELKYFFKDLWQNQSLTFLNKFTDTVSEVMNDVQSLTEKHRVKCTLIDKDENVTTYIKTRRSSCGDFKLCTKEFRQFLTDFYEHLNDTTVNAFRNYAAMYTKDVNSDTSDEKLSVIITLGNLSDIVERRVNAAFIKRTSKISLHEMRNKEANIQAIKDYVTNTIKYVNKQLKKHLEADLSQIKARLLLVIKEDININLDVELRNLESKFLERICTFFITCNGEVSSSNRKRFKDTDIRSDPHSVYVKVELTLDDELKDSIERNNPSNVNIRKTDIRSDVKNLNHRIPVITRTTLATTLKGSHTNMTLYLNITND